jgi:hypothetical protein
MQMWEMVRRLLKATGQGHSFTPGLVAIQYRSYLEGAGESDLPSSAELSEWANSIGDDLKDAGLIKPAAQEVGSSAALLGAMVLTELGGELSQALGRHNVVLLFESMMVEIEPGEIQRVLYQLNS